MVTILYHLEANGIFSLEIVCWFRCRFDWTFICEYTQVCVFLLQVAFQEVVV